MFNIRNVVEHSARCLDNAIKGLDGIVKGLISIIRAEHGTVETEKVCRKYRRYATATACAGAVVGAVAGAAAIGWAGIVGGAVGGAVAAAVYGAPIYVGAILGAHMDSDNHLKAQIVGAGVLCVAGLVAPVTPVGMPTLALVMVVLLVAGVAVGAEAKGQLLHSRYKAVAAAAA